MVRWITTPCFTNSFSKGSHQRVVTCYLFKTKILSTEFENIQTDLKVRRSLSFLSCLSSTAEDKLELQPRCHTILNIHANVSRVKEVKMSLAGVSLLFLAVLMVEIQAQWFQSNGVTFLGQTGLPAGNQLQTAFPFSNLGLRRSSTGTNGLTQTSFLQQIPSIPVSSTSLGSLVDPQLLGPNEGLGHDSPQQSQSILTTGTALSSGTQSGVSTNNAPISPYSLPSRISPLRGPNGEVFRITSDALLPLISPDQFNRLPTLGGNGDAVTSTGEYINTLAPRPGGQSGSGFQFEPSFGPGFPGPPPFLF